MARAASALAAFVLLIAAILVLAADGGDVEGPGSPTTTGATATTGAARRGAEPPTSRAPALRPARCAPGAPAGCEAVTGRVLFIESVDADNDGDLHVVAAGGGITAPGITVFDVRRDLRPSPDPRPGDRVTGAGPVFRGRFGQRQIEVTEFRVSRRR